MRELALERVDALAIGAFDGGDRAAHLLAQGTAEETADGMRLPAGGLHQIGEGSAVGASQQGHQGSRLSALAG